MIAPAPSCCSQAWQRRQGLPADLYSMLFDSAKAKLSPHGAILLHEIAAMCLRCTHGAGVSMRGQKRWTLEEKAQLAGGVESSVENRTSNAVRSLRKRDGTEQASTAAFPKAIFSAESASMEQTDATAPQQLHTKTWRKIDAAKRLPDGAEVDWSIGVARIPKTWTLTLPRKALRPHSPRRPWRVRKLRRLRARRRSRRCPDSGHHPVVLYAHALRAQASMARSPCFG
jgi:hypothetical protein